MKKVDLGQTLQILGTAGVILGILLLVYELNQNRQMMRAQIRHEMSDSFIQQLLLAGSNESVAELYIQSACGSGTVVSCDSTDQFRYDNLMMAIFRYWEDVHYQYRLELYDESEYKAQTNNWVNVMSSPRNRELWSTAKPMFSLEFSEALDALLADQPAE